MHNVEVDCGPGSPYNCNVEDLLPEVSIPIVTGNSFTRIEPPLACLDEASLQIHAEGLFLVLDNGANMHTLALDGGDPDNAQLPISVFPSSTQTVTYPNQGATPGFSDLSWTSTKRSRGAADPSEQLFCHAVPDVGHRDRLSAVAGVHAALHVQLREISDWWLPADHCRPSPRQLGVSRGCV